MYDVAYEMLKDVRDAFLNDDSMLAVQFFQGTTS